MKLLLYCLLVLGLAVAPALAGEAEPPAALADRGPESGAIPGCSRAAVLAGGPLPFGCATALNREAMLAEPSHLVVPAPVPPARGDAAIRAQEQYRSGKAARPPVASAFEGQGGGAVPQ
ncbi:MAG: hypothetical protein SNJ63_04485 [Sphingomonadaceae bacterium]